MANKKLFLYIDETGNTGLNHFDSEQPLFILGSAISELDLDQHLKAEFEKLKSITGEAELHAKKLGVSGINKISKQLVKIIEKNDIKFQFSLVEKLYHVGVMIFHLIYDPGINPAASNHGFQIRQLRMALSFNFLLLLDQKVIMTFWESTQKNNITQFTSVLKEIQNRLKFAGFDHRSTQLLFDALEYTIQNPDEIFNSMTFKKSVSSNISSFTSLLNSLQEMYVHEKNVKVEKVTHDEQKEFGHVISEAFKFGSQMLVPTQFNSLLAQAHSTHVLKSSSFNFAASKDSPGVQLIDIALWVFKRVGFNESHGIDQKLVNAIHNRAYIMGNTFEFHHRSMMEGTMEVMKIDLSNVNDKKVKKLLTESEAKRWKSKPKSKPKAKPKIKSKSVKRK